MEIWKDIPNYEGYYQASTEGRIRSVDRIRIDNYHLKGRVLKNNKLKDGYKQVLLMVDNKKDYEKVHRLVAQTFIPNPDNKPQVNHKNGNKGDNRVENLEWVTRSENMIHAYDVLGVPHNTPLKGKPSLMRKLTIEQINAIKKDGRTQKIIAKDYGACQQTISNIKTGKCYAVNW